MNYIEIVDVGKSYADRKNDPEIAANIDLMLRFGEARMSRKLKKLKASVRAIVPTVTDLEYYSLPPDYGGIRDIQVNFPEGNGKTRTLHYLNPEQMNQKSMDTAPANSNALAYYTIIADQFQIQPTVEVDNFIEIVYYQRIPALTSVASTNWVSEEHPDMYLSSLMYEIEIFVKNYEAADGWTARLDKAMAEIDISDEVERWGGTPMTTKLDYLTNSERRSG